MKRERSHSDGSISDHHVEEKVGISGGSGGGLKGIIEMIKTSPPSEAIQVLLYLKAKVALLATTDRQLDWLLPELIEFLKETEHDSLKINLLHTISLIATFPEAKTDIALLYLLELSKTDCSSDCKRELYSGLKGIFSTKLILGNHYESVKVAMQLCWEDIKSSNYLIRSSALSLMAVLASLSSFSDSLTPEKKELLKFKQLPLSAEDIQMLLVNYGEDPDPRVRKEAIKALRLLHLRGTVIKPCHYQLCVQGLGDEFEEVRLESIDLLWLVSANYPEVLVSAPGVSDKIRLVDDAFVNVCNLASDVSAKVRAKGFLLLGSFRLVNSSILLQTFSKKLSRGRANEGNSSQNQTKISQITADGEYEMKAEEIRFLKAGECGAFIHGLEDEFQEVRAASVDSICQLCMHFQEFAIKALDFLVDGFNDEIDSVRISSISSIAKIGATYPLTIDEEQLQIILSVLEDKKASIRTAVHEVLSLLYLESITILPLLVNAIIANLLRTPTDLDSIYGCLRKVGLHHAKKIDEAMINNLLNIDKKFLAVEGNKEDIAYVAKAVLILNASFAEPSLDKYVPEFMKNHLIYLRHKYPLHLNESLTDSQEIIMLSKAVLEPKTESDSDKILLLMAHTVDSIKDFDFKTYHNGKELKNQISQTQKTLKYLASNLTHNSEKAKFLLVLLDSLMIVSEFNSKTLSLSEGDLLESPRLLDLAYQMEFRYLGFPETTISFFQGLRIFASLIYYLIQTFSSKSEGISDGDILELILHRIDECLSSQQNDKIHHYLSQSRDHINSLISSTESGQSISNEKKTLLNFLLKHVLEFPIEIPYIPDTIKEVKATILKPITNPSNPREFSPELPVSFHLKCQLSYVYDLSSICIEIQYPNLLLHTIYPPPTSFSKLSSHRYTLNMVVTLLLPAWKEQGSIKLQVARAFRADLPEIDTTLLASARHHLNLDSDSEPNPLATVVISHPVEIFYEPLNR